MRHSGRTAALAVFLALAAATRARAQDVGAQWVDRITRELQADRVPLKEPSQFIYGADAGVQFAYDSNIFLTQDNRTTDEMWIPFVEANASYAEPQWEVSADLLVDYKYYVHTHQARSAEERAMLKAGYAGPIIGGSLVQLIRNESDPLDATFANREQRLVSDTLPRVYLDVTPIWALEADGLVEIVRFKDSTLAESRDNDNYNGALGIVYKTQVSIDFIAKGGLRFIHYSGGQDALGNPTAPPDVSAEYFMIGARGEIRPDLSVDALIGGEHVSTRAFDFVTMPSHPGIKHNTMNAAIWLRYKAVERLTASLGYTRDLGFLGGQDPYQFVDSILLLADYQAMEQVVLQANIQASVAKSALAVHRTYTSAGLIATWKPLAHVVIDGGVTGRFGDVTGQVTTDVHYTDLIVQLGVALSW
jgi:hypothetical protein